MPSLSAVVAHNLPVLLLEVLGFVVALCMRATFNRSKNQLNLPFPPGPKPSAIPFVDNIADMPSSQEWKTFYEWGRLHGPLVMVEVMGQKILIINSYAVADELLIESVLAPSSCRGLTPRALNEASAVFPAYVLAHGASSVPPRASGSSTPETPSEYKGRGGNRSLSSCSPFHCSPVIKSVTHRPLPGTFIFSVTWMYFFT
ncbi:hypothetical protein B0H14DRAFT_2880935 [Mycena olivaceomarginata]|nr:hypothetical protein B0H14DRAFT_2880935 [Mycena olivaceomarginata]